MIGLIVASFGTLDGDERARTIDRIESELIEAFPSMRIVSALTSNFILRRLSEKKSIAGQIEKLRAESIDKIIILPTHLTPGEEFEQKIKPFESDRVRVLEPLFTSDCSTAFDRRALEVIVECFRPREDEQLVLIGHGSPHRHNPVYENLQRLDERICVGVIEPSDRPNFDDVIGRLNGRLDRDKKILLAPLLLTGGVHVNEDIAGLDRNSWLSRLLAEGFDVRVDPRGLGSFRAFRRLYLEKLMTDVRKLKINISD